MELVEVTFGGSIQSLETVILPGACKRGLLRILRLDTGSLGNDMDLTGNLKCGRKTHNLILVEGGEDLRTDPESLGEDGDLREILGGGMETHDHILVGGGEVERRRDPRPTAVQLAYRPSQESVLVQSFKRT